MTIGMLIIANDVIQWALILALIIRVRQLSAWSVSVESLWLRMANCLGFGKQDMITDDDA